MKKTLLLFVVIFACSVSTFSQQDIEKITKNFEFNWNEYLLPKCSFLIYHGKQESYFIDSKDNRIPNHSYVDIKTGGKHHFIVQAKDGFHLLDTNLVEVTEKPYESIQLNFGSELELKTSAGKTTYYAQDRESKAYKFSDIGQPPPPWAANGKRTYNLKLGEVSDVRFKSKRIERLRIGIDMTKTLSTEQKGKNLLVKKDGNIVFKGKSKPMLYYDFMITGEKGPHSLYHSSSKDPILENCDRFWCVESFLVVSIKGSQRKHIVSNRGEIVLSSSGEIRYYDYSLGGHDYSFFCDGRSIVNLNGNELYRSDGELIGVAEHYIYAGNRGGYLSDLSHGIKMDCINFKRIGQLTIGQLGKNSWRLYDSKSILINEFKDFYYAESDSVLVCTEDDKTIVANPYTGKIFTAYSSTIRAQRSIKHTHWKFYATATNDENIKLEGRFHPKKGIIVEPKYLKIEWPKSEAYYIVVTKEGNVRYLKKDGQALFD